MHHSHLSVVLLCCLCFSHQRKKKKKKKHLRPQKNSVTEAGASPAYSLSALSCFELQSSKEQLTS